MVDGGHVQRAPWRFDRLSRNLGDLIMLADRFGQAGVALHSFTEKIDLSSATGRMFYNILGSFAQFYREQLAENVRMGMQQAVRQGKWINRPKTGYDLMEGELHPQRHGAGRARIFTCGPKAGARAHRQGHRHQVLDRADDPRIPYLPRRGPENGEWFPGRHEPIITPERFDAAHRGRCRADPGTTSSRAGSAAGCAIASCRSIATAKAAGSTAAIIGARAAPSPAGRIPVSTGPPSSDCGSSATTSSCKRPSASSSNGPERRPSRPAEGTPLAARVEWPTICRGNVASCCGCTTPTRSGPTCSPRRRLACPWPSARHSARLRRRTSRRRVPTMSTGTSTSWSPCSRVLDIDSTWSVATEVERRVLIDEFIEEISVLPDYLDVKVHGAPPLHVRYQEVGMKESGFDRVGGGIRINSVGIVDAYPAWGSAHVGARFGGDPVREVGTTELWLPAA